MKLSNEANRDNRDNRDNLETDTSHTQAVTENRSEVHSEVHSESPTAGAAPATSGTNSFKAYDTQLPVATLPGYRVVKCLYKAAKTGANAGKAVAANSYIYIADSITKETVSANISALMPHIVSYLQGVEDELVKGKHKAGSVFVSDAALGLEAVVEKLEEKSIRLNKEMVEAWFDAEIATPLIEALAEKLEVSIDEAEGGESTGYEISESELQKLVNVADMYKAKYAALAGGKTMYTKADAEILQKALVVCKVEKSGIGERFYIRLEAMKNKVVADSLADFGL